MFRCKSNSSPLMALAAVLSSFGFSLAADSAMACPRTIGQVVTRCLTADQKNELCLAKLDWSDGLQAYRIAYRETQYSTWFGRTFVGPEEVLRADDRRIKLEAGKIIFGYGSKTHFVYDKQNQTATLKIRNGIGVRVGDGAPVPPRRGTFQYEFQGCVPEGNFGAQL